MRIVRLLMPVIAMLACPLAAAAAAPKAKTRKEPKPMQYGPPKEGKWKVYEPMTDEFESGRLDPAKWHPRNPTWKGRQPALFRTQNVAVRDGKLHLTMRREDVPDAPPGYHTFTSAAVQSKTTVRYGYFEIKCRPMDSRGSSAFWFHRNTPEIWTEIDVFEIGAKNPKHERLVHMNVHVFHTLVNPDRHWSRAETWTAPFRLADGYHVYALDWNEKELVFYVDGEVVRRQANTHWHQPLNLDFDSETMPKWFGLPKEANLPSTFSIEYVRAWKRVDAPRERRVRSCVFRFPRAKAEAVGGKSVRLPIAADEGTVVVVARFGRTARPSRVHLEYENDAFFASQKAREAHKTIRIKDDAGRAIDLAIWWQKTKGYKPNNGYRPDCIEVRPAERAEPGAETKHRFTTKAGRPVEMIITH